MAMAPLPLLHPSSTQACAFAGQSMAELGLSSFLINAGNESDTWPSPRYRSLLIMFCFNSVWTTIFSTSYILWVIDGSVHLLASIASSIAWILVTASLWAVSSGIMHHTRTGGNCAGFATISRCRQSLTVEALGWTELGLSSLVLIATCIWVRKTGWKRQSILVNDSRMFV